MICLWVFLLYGDAIFDPAAEISLIDGEYSFYLFINVYNWFSWLSLSVFTYTASCSLL